MGVSRTIIAGVCAVGLAGCFALPKPKPFVRPVAAEPLRAIALPEVDVPLMALPAARPAPAPQRSDVAGKDDGSMKTDRVIVTARDIPHRAPDYSPEQTASFVCRAEKDGFNLNNARRAHEATVFAKEMRAKVDAGLVTLKAANDAELKRQEAIRGYTMPVPLLGLMIGGGEKKSELPPPRSGDLVIENPDLFTFTENGKPVMAVSGTIRNVGSVAAELPPLTLQAIDQWDFVLAGQSSLLPFESVAPGEAKEFEMRFLNPPEYTAEVYVHFAPPFIYRNRRDCDFFDPSTFDADRKADALVQTPAAAVAPADSYAASELNTLTQYYRREAATAWRCRDASRRGCFWAVHSLRWRDMFAMSEAIDEAWIALRAAEETRGRQAKGEASDAEAAKAEEAREAMVARFRAMGERALARAGGSVADVVVDLSASNYGRDEQGLFVTFAGVLRNTGAVERRVDALMVAFVDRFELPLSSVAVTFPRVLKPGESVAFSERIMARQNAGLGNADTELAPGMTAPVLARVPPGDIRWEVRVGAMGR